MRGEERHCGDRDPEVPEQRGRQGRADRAVLRPRLRLRDHPALPPAAQASRPAGRGPDADPGAGRVVGVDVHRVEHQLPAARPPGDAVHARRRDGRRAGDGGGAAGRLRRARPVVRRRLRDDPGGADHRGHGPVQGHRSAGRLHQGPGLAPAVGRALDRRSSGRRHRSGAAVAGRPGGRVRRAGDRLSHPVHAQVGHDRLDDRRLAHGRALPAVRHHRARRVRAGHRGDAGGTRLQRRRGGRLRRLLPRQRGPVVGVLRPHRRGPPPRPSPTPTTLDGSAAPPTPTSTSRWCWASSSRRSATSW